MVRRYAHLAADHLTAYAGNLEIHGTKEALLPQPCQHPPADQEYRELRFGLIARQQLRLVLPLRQCILRSLIPFTRSAARAMCSPRGGRTGVKIG